MTLTPNTDTDMTPRIHRCTNRAQCAQLIATRVLRLAADAVERRGRFTLAVSGGSVSEIVGEALVSESARSAVWDAWHVFWVDERCVPSAHADSNFGAAERSWLVRIPIPRRQIYPMDGEREPKTAARAYESMLAEVASTSTEQEAPRLDLILLGIGEDGHIASLFPGHTALNEHNRWVTTVTDAPKPPPARITLTLPVLNHARHIAFIAIGANKAAIVRRVLEPETKQQPPVPAQLIDASRVDVEWHLDSEAARELRRTYIRTITPGAPS